MSNSVGCYIVVLVIVSGISLITLFTLFVPGLLLCGPSSVGLSATSPASKSFGRCLLPVITCGIRPISLGDSIRISCSENPLRLVLERLEAKGVFGAVSLLPMANILEKLSYVGFLHCPGLAEHHALW